MSKQAHVDADEDGPTEIKIDLVFEDFTPPAREPCYNGANASSDFQCLKEEQTWAGKEPWSPFLLESVPRF